jgi:uncharacterized protein (TIGR02145 family)
LYNWYAVNTHKLAPKGWHVPTDEEWATLENYLIFHGYNYDGSTGGDFEKKNKIAKALASAKGWRFSNSEGAVGNTDYPAKRNVTGFTALPGGARYSSPGGSRYSGEFSYFGFGGEWWSSSELNTDNAWRRYMNYSSSSVGRLDDHKSCGFLVRCIRD